MKISILAGGVIVLTVGFFNRDILAGSPDTTNNVLVRTYEPGKRVSDFPTNVDLSTPEAAYAACNRLCASGEQDGWRQLSVKKLAARLPVGAKKIEVPASAAKEWLGAEIVEVRIHKGSLALVFAKIPQAFKTIIDIRTFEKEAGQWRNAGNGVASSLEKARDMFSQACAFYDAERKRDERPPISNPQDHLRPFVEFLQREAADPQQFILKAVADHSVVVMGEVHNRPRYWEFNTKLVRSPEFPRHAGVIYLEFPINDQPLIDGFLAASKFDPAPVINMLRDMFENGWPDQPTLEFFQAVWEVNQALPPAKRLRIMLVDMARPWKEIHKREDWKKYDVDRDDFMAKNVIRDRQAHTTDARHALFIVGWMHTLKNMTYPGGKPIRAAGWHLQQKLGASNVFAVFPHCPVMSNRGEVKGRLALGLFETAFAALTNRPIAFPLDHGPFGEQLFDASLDFVTTDPFRAGFDAYLYLGPLENEIMSPLIPGFYTDEYAKEMDRRFRLMNGRGLAEITDTDKPDAESYARLRARWWGQPRTEWSARSLGPLNAWQFGSDREKKGGAAQPASRPAGKADANQRLKALVENFFSNNFRDITSRETLEWGDMATDDDGNVSIRYKYRAKIWGQTTITNNQVFTFDSQGEFVSVDDASSASH